MTTSLLSCSTDGETVLTQEVKRPKRVGRERSLSKEQEVEDGQKLSTGLLRTSVDGGRGKKTKQLLGLGAWKCTEWGLRAGGRHGHGGHLH